MALLWLANSRLLRRRRGHRSARLERRRRRLIASVGVQAGGRAGGAFDARIARVYGAAKRRGAPKLENNGAQRFRPLSTRDTISCIVRLQQTARILCVDSCCLDSDRRRWRPPIVAAFASTLPTGRRISSGRL